MDIVAKASAFAADKHGKQRRKCGDQPYFNHLASVVRTKSSLVNSSFAANAFQSAASSSQ